MYIYKNISGKDVNVRGVAFCKNGVLNSNIIIAGFQDAVNKSILSLRDTSAASIRKDGHPMEAHEAKKEEVVKQNTRKSKEKEKVAVTEDVEAEVTSSSESTKTVDNE